MSDGLARQICNGNSVVAVKVLVMAVVTVIDALRLKR